jgi:hypothetical protein
MAMASPTAGSPPPQTATAMACLTASSRLATGMATASLIAR